MASFDQAIPPGGVGKITFTVNTKGYAGRVTKRAVVRSNDPRHQTLNLSLSADIRSYIVIEPSSIVVLRGIVGDDIRRVLQIRAGDGYPLEILEVSTNMAQWVDCKILTKEGDHLYELEVRSKARGQIIAGGNIRLVTNNPKKPEMTVPVQLQIRPECEVLPPEIAFGAVPVPSSGEKVMKTVTLVNNRGMTLRIRGLRYNKKFFKVTAVPSAGENASRYRIEVEPRLDRLPTGSVSDTLIIKLEGTKTEEVKVPLSIVVQKEGQKSGGN